MSSSIEQFSVVTELDPTIKPIALPSPEEMPAYITARYEGKDKDDLIALLASIKTGEGEEKEWAIKLANYFPLSDLQSLIFALADSVTDGNANEFAKEIYEATLALIYSIFFKEEVSLNVGENYAISQIDVNGQKFNVNIVFTRDSIIQLL